MKIFKTSETTKKTIYLVILAALLVFSGQFSYLISRAEESPTPETLQVLTSDILLATTSEATPAPEITLTSEATSTPEITLTLEASSTPELTLTLEASSTPELTSTLEASSTPELILTLEATSTLEASSTPELTLTLEATSTPELASTSTPTLEATSTPEVKIPQKYLSFSLEGSPFKTGKNLPWFPEKFHTGENKENAEINIEISGQNRSKIILSGACQKNYFVVLVFAQPNDYIENPTRFIYNKAFLCQNGSYYYELNDLPGTLKNDVYYFMVAEEGLTGPWQPITAIQPVRANTEYE